MYVVHGRATTIMLAIATLWHIAVGWNLVVVVVSPGTIGAPLHRRGHHATGTCTMTIPLTLVGRGGVRAVGSLLLQSMGLPGTARDGRRDRRPWIAGTLTGTLPRALGATGVV